jgi:hypothetical protein
MSATVRNFKERILIGNTGTTQVTSDAPVHIQEQLEQGGTYVAEFNVNQDEVELDTDVLVAIDHINQGVATDDGYEMKRLYLGVVNKITAVSYPHQVTVTCTGPLALLRKSPSVDIDVSSYTDITLARYILTFCGVDFDDADISGVGAQLGPRVPVFWTANQTGQALLDELDSVFGCATIEIGEGRVFRFPYSRVPYDYDSSDVSKVFYRGQIGGTFYGNERDRGDIDSIQNVWIVTGASWQGATGSDTEGCNYTIFGKAQAVHPKLGAGVEVKGELSSDFIQDEGVAAMIAERQLRWYCREPDTIRIDTSNDGLLNVGDVIGVRDSIYGIDLATTARYLILNITREGDDMTIDGVGGVAITEYSVNSGIELCCGTQKNDGTCSDDGNNPGPDNGPDPGKPDDSFTGHCDPLSDPTCIPGDDYPLPPEIDTEDPYICSSDGGVSTGSPGAAHDGGGGTTDCIGFITDVEGAWHHRCYAERA